MTVSTYASLLRSRYLGVFAEAEHGPLKPGWWDSPSSDMGEDGIQHWNSKIAELPPNEAVAALGVIQSAWARILRSEMSSYSGSNSDSLYAR